MVVCKREGPGLGMRLAESEPGYKVLTKGGGEGMALKTATYNN